MFYVRSVVLPLEVAFFYLTVFLLACRRYFCQPSRPRRPHTTLLRNGFVMQVSSCRLRATVGGQREGFLREAYLLRFGMRVLAFRPYSLVRDEIWHLLVFGESGRRGSRTWLLRQSLGRFQRRQDPGDAPPLLRPQIRLNKNVAMQLVDAQNMALSALIRAPRHARRWRSGRAPTGGWGWTPGAARRDVRGDGRGARPARRGRGTGGAGRTLFPDAGPPRSPPARPPLAPRSPPAEGAAYAGPSPFV